MNLRAKSQPGTPSKPATPWMASAMMGLAIFAMAGSAAALGAGVALSEAAAKPCGKARSAGRG